MIELSLLTVTLLVAGQVAITQPGAAAGGQIQQIPPAPSQTVTIPDLRVERREAPASPLPAGPTILVNALQVTGQTQFTEAELIAVAGFQPGSQHDLGGLQQMAQRITDFYGREGFFVARAYVPAQSIDQGSVTIAVVEGRYEKVTVENHANVSTSLVQDVVQGIEPGDIVVSAPLERRLLLLSDIPGVVVRSTLTPGEAVGASNLLIDLMPGRRVTGSLEADNAGSRYTGPYRVGGSVNFNAPFGIGDVASLRVLTSGSGLTYARASYEARLQNLTLGAAYAYLEYELGEEFEPLDASGTASIASLYASYPLIRSRQTNLRALLQLDVRDFHDEVGTTSSVTDRSARVVIAGLSGERRDSWGGGGFTSYALNWASGDLHIKTPALLALDAVTAQTEGSYSKISFDAAHLRQVRPRFSIYAHVRGQLASKNLDSSEKMELGGAYGVRAYPAGEAYGDEGYLATLEGRVQLARPSRPAGTLTGSLFVDAGHVTLNETPWMTGENSRTLSAMGVGLTWADSRNLARISYAHQLGDDPATSAPDRSGRVWVQLSRIF